MIQPRTVGAGAATEFCRLVGPPREDPGCQRGTLSIFHKPGSEVTAIVEDQAKRLSAEVTLSEPVVNTLPDTPLPRMYAPHKMGASRLPITSSSQMEARGLGVIWSLVQTA